MLTERNEQCFYTTRTIQYKAINDDVVVIVMSDARKYKRTLSVVVLVVVVCQREGTKCKTIKIHVAKLSISLNVVLSLVLNPLDTVETLENLLHHSLSSEAHIR